MNIENEVLLLLIENNSKNLPILGLEMILESLDLKNRNFQLMESLIKI
jgi:hypothetical protein